MSERVLDSSGVEVRLIFRQGDTPRYASEFTNLTDLGLTLSAARIGFTDDATGLAVAAGYAQISGATVTWGIATAAETRLFDATGAARYRWFLEVDLSNGDTQTIYYGPVEARQE